MWRGEALPTAELEVGQSFKLEPGTAHRPFNPSAGERCRFLLVQGIGEYDWVRYEPKASAAMKR